MGSHLIEHVHDVVDVLHVFRLWPIPNIDPMAEVSRNVERIRVDAFNHQAQFYQSDWELLFRNVGAAVIRMVLRCGDTLDPEEFAAMLLEKHKRYGATPLTKWGPMGIIIRIDSKLERWHNLSQNPTLNQSTDESSLDTLRDILGYAVLGYVMAKNRANTNKI